MSDEELVDTVNELLGYLSPDEEGDGNLIGRRLAGTGADAAAERDPKYVDRMREIVDALSEEVRSALDPEKLACLEEAEGRLAEE